MSLWAYFTPNIKHIFSTHRYEAVCEEPKNQLSEQHSQRTTQPVDRRTPPGRQAILLTFLFVLGTVLGFLLAIVSTETKDVKNANLRQCSSWSPILDDIEIPKYSTMMNGTFFSPPNPSIARQDPSPENDAAWRAIWEKPPFILTRDQVLKLGKDPETATRFENAYWGLGDDAYPGKLDIVHQIHCLDAIRKGAFSSYPGYDPGLDTSQPVYWIHLGHCVDMLMQFLMCNADTSVLTFGWIDGQPEPWPDFSIHRQCRDLDTIMKWQDDQAVDMEKFLNTPRPKDAFVWPDPLKHGIEFGHPLETHGQQEGHPGGVSVTDGFS